MSKIINGIDYCMEYLDDYKINFGYIFPHGLINPKEKEIVVSNLDSLEEQIKTLIHELIHMHPVFLSFSNDVISGKYPCCSALHLCLDKESEFPKKYRFTDSQIEKLAQETYQNRPDIVERIKQQIEKAKICL